ncbi:two-component sensor histidine kinase [Bacillus pseudomycoides]|uniref:sensor histidine kinase n=1 Tax=Bacillus pseudomycoides TaxID=64104 RepID=UPI000BEC4219|nr:HAMP domain-containing sensor histidine kinase [Bacillus pseudomycoides]PDY00258.1 two-component sensor histidine kinase [Bacillus pseudomycoides]PEK79390.1 two-component sensor histidine kinase [Bacillus pseudomycoides]PEN02912.1 two-component sensor histidine kinase [Bacillus pseudomycoides]PGB82375.1 two-component sensor histidine kinase [Bacillus pseudomycoides]PHE55453.1 two-component sensor histidine kinase [Bacillus pseudomycoides]
MKKIFEPFYYLNDKIVSLVKKLGNRILGSIRIQLITTFFLCALLGFFVSRAVAPFAEDMNQRAYVDYSFSMLQINRQAKETAEKAVSENKVAALQEMIESEDKKEQKALKVLVTDETGKVLYKTKQAPEVEINLHSTISNVMHFAMNRPIYNKDSEIITGSRKEFITFYPVTIEGKNLYMFVSGIPEGDITYETEEGILPSFIGIIVFIFSFFYITKRKMKQIEAMAQGVNEIAKGNLAYRIEEKGQDEMALLTKNINQMAEEIMVNIEKEREIERQKNELITNVSHDLRTPLTSIMGYLRLLRDAKYDNREQYDEYIKVAFSKSEQLKNLIEDLFEYTKLTNEKVVLEKQEVCINEMLDQLIEELVPQAEEHGLSFVKEFPDERIYAELDSEKIVRVFDNLLMNAIKYSKDEGEIKISLQRQQDNIQISVANQSEEFTRQELKNLFERFYKKDQSRSRVSEGSGLGLAIAKSIVDLQSGDIRAEYEDGIVRFIISLPIEAEK